MRVALVYDRVNKWGGAERVLLALHELFPNAPLYTSVYDKEKAPWADVFDIRTSFLQNIPFAVTNHELFAFLMPLAFESFSFDEFDLVISLTSESAKGIITKPGTVHICYCLTPTRYLWSAHDDYFKNDGLKRLSKSVIASLRRWDIAASQRPDEFIAISKEVQRRINKYYGRESTVVYPPATLENPKSEYRKAKQIQNAKYKIQEKEYFLVVSRLSKFTKYKRIDLAVEACNKLKLPLKVIGSGNLKEDLKSKAGVTIEFLGAVCDSELINYYKNCKALIFPGNEDLGLVMIEAQKYGKPVIAYRAGGAKEIVVDPTDTSGQATGLFFDQQTVKSLSDALQKFEKMKFDPSACIKNAERFNISKFKKNFLSVVNNLI